LNAKVSQYYIYALQDIADGSSIRDLEQALNYYEELEEYEACAGIKKAIVEVKESTINAIKIKLNDIKRNKRKG
jgi:hypothetical protein